MVPSMIIKEATALSIISKSEIYYNVSGLIDDVLYMYYLFLIHFYGNSDNMEI